ncbi:MAG: tRNA lysidine(34) synthetase TilS [Planctomycetes bacterium]|nr:tRNA lysidine(34) synthetase TilS [Planctomycetota bacterium]
MNDSTFLERLLQDCPLHKLIPPKSGIVVGVSGGVDSTVLLHALQRVGQIIGESYHLHVAHFDHQLRGEESTGDAEFVSALADSLGLPFTIERSDGCTVDARNRGSQEDVARRERFAFFERVCKRIDATHLALAHHADDQVETILHRFLRGTGIRGLAGMAVRRLLHESSDVMVFKPMLHLTRAEIVEFASAENIAYREDSSNQSTDHTRNRIRRDLIPYLEKEFNPRIRQAILRLGEQSEWTNHFIREVTSEALNDAITRCDDSSITLSRCSLADQPIIIQTAMLRMAIARLGTRERRLTFQHVKDIVDAVDGDGSKWRFALPDGVDVQLRQDKIIVSRNPKCTIESKPAGKGSTGP